MKAKSIIRLVIGTALILLVPLVAMRFSDEVKWDLKDFIVIGVLLIGAGLVYELVAAKAKAKYRPVIAIVFVALVLLIWVELAVGIFD